MTSDPCVILAESVTVLRARKAETEAEHTRLRGALTLTYGDQQPGEPWPGDADPRAPRAAELYRAAWNATDAWAEAGHKLAETAPVSVPGVVAKLRFGLAELDLAATGEPAEIAWARAAVRDAILMLGGEAP